jgi:hypothetical protein
MQAVAARRELTRSPGEVLAGPIDSEQDRIWPAVPECPSWPGGSTPPQQAGYTTALGPLGVRLAISLDIREASIYGLLAQECPQTTALVRGVNASD